GRDKCQDALEHGRSSLEFVAIDADIRSENYRHIDLGQNAFGFSAQPENVRHCTFDRATLMLATDVMRTSFATVKPNAPVLDAVRLLLETNQRGLPVIDDNGSLVGVISEGDFLHRREMRVTCSAGFLLVCV